MTNSICRMGYSNRAPAHKLFHLTSWQLGYFRDREMVSRAGKYLVKNHLATKQSPDFLF